MNYFTEKMKTKTKVSNRFLTTLEETLFANTFFLAALSKFLFCFSARKNLEELPRKDKNIALHPIYGLRSIIMILVVSVHSRLVTLSGPVNNYGNAVTVSQSCLCDAISSLFFFLVDTPYSFRRPSSQGRCYCRYFLPFRRTFDDL